MAAIQLGMAFVAGLALGLFYFGGLWLTLRLLPRVRYAALLMIGSLVVRMGVTMLGFYLVMGNQVERVAACLLGFIAVRILLSRRIGPGTCAQGEEAAGGCGRH